MEVAVLCIAAFIVAGVTFFSGFGLGTLLMPIFALFFPIEVAISMTAIVHLLNNVLKLFLVGRYADRYVMLRFGIPALLAAFVGAWVLAHLSNLSPFMHYQLLGYDLDILPIKLVIGSLLIVFTLLELVGEGRKLVFDKPLLPLGGVLSGFFGGLSGHQGALRSAFLIRAGLSKERFLGTGVAIACLVDLARLTTYGVTLPAATMDAQRVTLLAAVASALAGTLAGNYLVEKMTYRTIQLLVSVMVLGIAVSLCLGVL
jgi:uncharacterized membrane protein YfcA